MADIDPQTGLEQTKLDQSGVVNAPKLRGFDVNYGVAPKIYVGRGVGSYKKDTKLNYRDVLDFPEDINYQRAELQSGPELLGKAIWNGLTEATLGALEGTGYALDFEELFNHDKQAQEGFDNWFSKGIRDFKESTQSDIYRTKDAESVSIVDKLSDSTFWADQGKTIGTSLSLMIPSIGVAKGISMLGNIGKAMSPIAASLFSRKAESAMEASQRFNEDYEYWKNDSNTQSQLINRYKPQVDSIDAEINRLSQTIYNPTQENYQQLEYQKQYELSQLQNQRTKLRDKFDSELDDIARTKAGEAASKTFKANAAMLPLDIAQYALMLKPFSAVSKTAEDVAKKSIGKKLAENILIQPGSEGLEEGYQSVVSSEASESTKLGQDMFGEGFEERLKKYVKDPNTQESILMGTLMGGIFEPTGHVIKKVYDKIKPIEKLVAQVENPNSTEGRYEALINNSITSSTIDLFKDDKFDINSKQKISELNGLKKFVQEKQDIEDVDKQKTIHRIDSHIESINFAKKQDDILKKDDRYKSPDVRRKYVQSQLEQFVHKNHLDIISEEINEVTGNSGFSGEEVELAKLLSQRANLISSTAQAISDNELSAEEKSSIKELAKQKQIEYGTKIDELKKSIKTNNSKFDKKNLSDLSNKIAANIKDKQASDLLKEAVLDNRVKKYANLNKAEAEQLAIQEKKNNDQSLIKSINSFIDKETDVVKLNEYKKLERQNPEVYAGVKDKLEAKLGKIKQTEQTTEVINTKNQKKQVVKDVINSATTEEEIDGIPQEAYSGMSKDDFDAITSQAEEKKQQIKEATPQVDPNLDKVVDAVSTAGKKVSGKIIGETKSGNYLVEIEQGKPSVAVKKDSIKIKESQVDPDTVDIEQEDLLDQSEFIVTKEVPFGDPIENTLVNINSSTDLDELVNEDTIEEAKQKSEIITGKYWIHGKSPLNHVAMSAVEFDYVNGRAVDKYDADGKIILTENYDASIANKDKFQQGSTVVLTVNKDDIRDYVKGKLIAENLPISVRNLEDFEAGKKPFMSIPDLSNKKYDGMNSTAKDNLIKLRQKIFEAYNKNPNSDITFYSIVDNKSGSQVVKGQYYRNLGHYLKLPDGNWANFTLASGNKDRQIKLESGELTLNHNTPPGIPHVIVRNSQNEAVGVSLDYEPLSANKQLYDEYITNIFQIIKAHVEEQPGFQKGVSSIHDEVDKYIHLKQSIDESAAKLKSATKEDKAKYNNIFGVQINKDGSYSLFLPGQGNYVQVRINKIKGNWVPQIYGIDGSKQTVTWNALLESMKKRLVDMYPNVSDNWGQNPKEFFRWEYKDDKLVKKQENYFDYLSDNNLVKTRVSYVLDKDGNHYFTVAPSIAINHNIKTEEEFGGKKSETIISPIEVKEDVIPTKRSGLKKIKRNNEEDGDIKIASPESDNTKKESKEFDKPISNIDYDNALLSSFTSMEDINVENNVMSSLLVDLLEKLEERRLNNQSFNRSELINDVLNDAIENIETFEAFSDQNMDKNQAVDFGAFANPEMNANAAKFLTHIKNNLDASYNVDGSIAFIGYKEKLDLLYKSVSFKSAYEISEEEEFDGSNNRENHTDNQNFKTDPEKSLSSQIRRLFSNVRVFDKNGNIEYNAIGHYKYEPFEKVFAYLISNLANTPIDEIYGKLVDLTKESSIAREVEKKLTKLREEDPSMFNGFMSAMRKQNAEFVTFLIEIDEKKNSDNKVVSRNVAGKTTITNRADLKSILLEKWTSTFNSSGLLDENGNINTQKSKETRDKFSKLNLNSSDNSELIKLFNQIGIEISDSSINKIREDFNINKTEEINGKNKSRSFTSQFGNTKLKEISFDQFFKGYFSSIFTALHNGLNTHNTQTAKIKVLANYQQRYEPNLYNSSYRNGNGDTVYAFVNPHHLSNTIEELTNPEFKERFNNDPFAKSSIWLKNPEQINLYYFDSSKQQTPGANAKDYQNQNPVEKEVTNVNLYLNNGDKTKSLFQTTVHSDKSTFPLIRAPRYQFNRADFLYENGKLVASDKILDKLYEIFVQPEIERIYKKFDLFDQMKKKGRLSELVENFEIYNGKFGAAKYFFILPELNGVVPRDEFDKPIINNDTKQIIYNTIKSYFEKQISSKIDFWESIGLKNNLDDVSFKNNYLNSLENLATSYVLDNSISFMNQLQLFTGDLAEFAKMSSDNIKDDWGAVIDSTIPNFFKRTAKDIAPGQEGLFAEKSYNTVYINEPVITSALANGDKKSPYADIKLADAQEWTTLKEHLRVMLAYHKIDKDTHDRILKNQDNLTYADLKIVFNPHKPVQTMRIPDGNGGLRTSYIKTSSYPLIPQLTKAFPELDKMRQFMESNNVDRIVPKSAVKVGYVNSIVLFDKDGNFIGDKNFKPSNIQSLERSGFKIQQDVPFDPEKDHILLGSQMSKQIHQDLDPTWDFNGKTAVEIKNEANATYKQLYSNAFNKIVRELKADGLKIKDVSKLKEMMIAEAIDKGYGLNEMLMMSTIKNNAQNSNFTIPLFFHPMLHKVEAILNSIIKNKVLKLKFPGKSFVQGSSLGFVVADLNWLKSIGGDNGVIFTKDFTGSLKYVKSDNELYAEILLPSHFKGVKLSDYVKNGFLDTSKIDPELLTMIGYRIPTSGFSSIIKLKVVGILPEVSGDLVIVSPEIVTQMGSDFDVDKLYIHWFNYDIQSNGKISKTRSLGNIKDLTEQQLQNNLLDIHMSILSNPNVIKKSITPLEDGAIKNLVEEHENKIKKEGVKTKYSSIISDELHTKMVETQASGKIGVGISSANTSFHSLAQYAGLYFTSKKTKEGNKWHSVKFSNNDSDVENFNDTKYLNQVEGDKLSFTPKDNTPNLNVKYSRPPFEGAWRLDKIYGFTGKPISQVLTNIQTESVDNANNGRLYPMNLNRNTFDVAMLIANVGFDERVIKYFLNQPIIRKYSQELDTLSQFTETDFIKDKRQKLQRNLLDSIGDNTSLDDLSVSNISIEEMEEPQYSDNINTELQARVLKNFIIYQDMADQLRTFQGIMNVDTRFNGKSQIESIAKQNNFNEKIPNLYIGNTGLFIEDTKSGDAFEFGINKSIELFGSDNLLPYNSVVISDIMDKISDITGKDLDEKDVEKIVNGIRSTIWSNIIKDYYGIESLEDKRRELLYGDNPLAKRLIEAQHNPKFKFNYFIQSLIPIIDQNKNKPSFVEHISSKSSKETVDFKKQLGWLELLKSSDGSYEYDLGHDLLIYSVIFGMDRNARDFGRFIPYDYIVNNGLDAKLREVDFNEGKYATLLSDSFVQQYFQHNPNKLPSFKTKDIVGGIAYPEIQLKQEFKEENGKFPQFAKIYTDNGAVVYKRIGEIYYKLDQLGTTFLSEYNLELSNGKTQVFGNIIGSSKIPAVESKAEFDEAKEVNSGVKILNDYSFNGGIPSVLNKISKSNSRFSQLAKYLIDNTSGVYKYSLEKFVPGDSRYKNSDQSSYDAKARLIWRDKIIAINPTHVKSTDDFESSFMHEAIHASAIELINTPDERLNSEQLEAKNSILKLYEDIKAKFPDASTRKHFSNAFKNIDEFIAEVMENKELQDLLNNTSYDRKNFLQKFLDLIVKLFSNVKKGSMLEAAFHDILNVMEQQETMSKEQLVEDFFVEVDKKEAEEIMKHCLESNKKSGNIAKSKYGRK